MSDTHSFEAHDAFGNRYRLTIYREAIGVAERVGAVSSPAASPVSVSIPVDIIGPRGEWVSQISSGRFLLQPLDKARPVVELFSDASNVP